MKNNPDAYKTIEEAAEGEFKDRGSKFFAYIKHIETESDFQDHMTEIKALHFKARHHCYGFRLLDTDIFRMSDDGEPSGTAGKPIFNQLLSFEVVNVSCIVVRYFGGTKLGTSGLINAYRETAKAALSIALILDKFIEEDFKLSFDYAIMGTLMDTLKHLAITIKEKSFDAEPFMILSAKASEVQLKKDEIKAHLLGRALADIKDDTVVKGLMFVDE